MGSGFIVRDIQLVAYKNAGFQVAAIASLHPENARQAAVLHDVPAVYPTYSELLKHSSIDILDIAVPPDQQLAVVREAVSQADHLKGILCQKPLAIIYQDAEEIVRLCSRAGIKLAVNQNMRYDQSIRALKALLSRGDLGQPVLATVEMRAVPHWQSWLQKYGRLTLLNMSIHHLDTFRYLFGDPESVFVSARLDPRTKFSHRDGICLYILEYANGLRAAAWDDVWARPDADAPASKTYIRWRVEGTEGMAQGTIGWPSYPNRQPSTIDFTTKRQAGIMFSPRWQEVWFPDAFAGTMGQLLQSVATGAEPEISGRDNLKTMALVEACYQSLEQRRLVRVDEVVGTGASA